MFESRENSYGIIRLTFPFGFSRDYGREKSSEIGVDGHDVPLIPHPSNAPPHPTNPTWAGGEQGGVGHVGLGGWGGTLGGWGIRRISCTYAHIHACWYQDYGGKKIGNYKIPDQIQPFSATSPAK